MGAVAVVLLALCGLDQMMFGGGMKGGLEIKPVLRPVGEPAVTEAVLPAVRLS